MPEITPDFDYEAASLARKRKLKGMVGVVLKECEDARNSDITLTTEIWKKYYEDILIKSPTTGRLAVALDRLGDLPREDNIKRVRAHIQNEIGLYPPTTWEVAKKRGFEEHVWKLAMGYRPTLF